MRAIFVASATIEKCVPNVQPSLRDAGIPIKLPWAEANGYSQPSLRDTGMIGQWLFGKNIDLIDLTHQPGGLGQGDDDLLVVPDVLE
ncbi:MAG: hypothetical protein IPM59_00220 [Chloracidobacterium sp.]|nr:hypothetical protein [Chloracidobacterium sp.]